LLMEASVGKVCLFSSGLVVFFTLLGMLALTRLNPRKKEGWRLVASQDSCICISVPLTYSALVPIPLGSSTLAFFSAGITLKSLKLLNGSLSFRHQGFLSA